MPLIKNLGKNSCKNPNLLPLLEPQCFSAAVVSPSPAVSARGVGWMRSLPGKYGLFITNNSLSSCLEWLHLNVTVVLKSLVFGGGGGTGRALCC